MADSKDVTLTDLTLAPIGFRVDVDAKDIVEALDNNDGSIGVFILEMLQAAGSGDLVRDLRDRLNDMIAEEDRINVAS